MKYLITLLTVLCSLTIKAQLNSDKLLGTWEMSEYTYRDNHIVPPLQGFKRYKMYTATNFAVIELNAETKVITHCIFGTYTLIDSTYNEHITNVSAGTRVPVGSNYKAVVKFDNEDSMSMVAILGGSPMDERWKKAKANPF